MIRLTYLNVIDCSADVARGTHRPDLHAEHARCELLICSSHDSRDDALPDSGYDGLESFRRQIVKTYDEGKSDMDESDLHA